MRSWCVLLLLLVVPTLGLAQVIPAGATPDEVVRVLGQPRTRSVAKEREIWRYDDHQVIFEHGRLTALVALPEQGGVVTWKKSGSESAGAAGGLSRVGSLGTRDAAGKGAMLVQENAGKLALRSPERAAPPVRPKERSVWPAVLITFLLTVGAAVGLAVWYVRWQRRIAAVLASKPAVSGGTAATTPPVAATAPAAPVAPEAARATAVPFAAATKPPSLVDWELTPEMLQTIEWKRFEMLVQRYYTATGLRARTHLVGADGGVELFLYRNGATRPLCYVQCRSWGRTYIDGPLVRELFTQMAENRIAEGVIVTTGTVSPEAEAFARQNRITLLSGADFLARFNRLPHLQRARILTEVTNGDYTTPSCPRCSAKLVVRERAADGSILWGCRRLPQCHYTVRPVLNEPAATAAT